MAFEITCGQCGGRLLVEQAGVIVACPMCDAHLSVPEHDEPNAPIPDAPVTDAPVTEAVPTAIAPAASAATEVAVEPPPASQPDDGGNVVLGDEPPAPTEWISHSSPRLEDVPPTEPILSEHLLESTPRVDSSQAAQDAMLASLSGRLDPFPHPTPADAAQGGIVVLPVSMDDADTIIAPPSTMTPVDVMAPASSTAPVSETLSSSTPADMVPRRWFILAAGCASAVALALITLLLFAGIGRRHALESLPDLVPPMDKSGQIGMKKVPPEMNVAPGHVLRLGESQRFGNVRVTPVRVTRGPIRFDHAFEAQKLQHEPTQPVLKLTLRFENVSTDQEFAPLDATLMYKRIFDRKAGGIIALNFLGPEAERRSGGELHYLYDLPEFSEYVLHGQDLNHSLPPGQSWETYVPSEEGIAGVDGEWVWRVLFRKGYNPDSKRGVTTLIDVRFDGNDVQEEAAG